MVCCHKPGDPGGASSKGLLFITFGVPLQSSRDDRPDVSQKTACYVDGKNPVLVLECLTSVQLLMTPYPPSPGA
jgi:hypothetical protein